MISKSPIRIALADDHVLFRTALSSLIESYEECSIMHCSGSGQELMDHLYAGKVPDVLLLDLNMPETNGYQIAERMLAEFPQVHVLMLSQYDSELALIRLLQSGIKGFLKKDITPQELYVSIKTVMTTGFYYSAHTAGKIASMFRSHKRDPQGSPLFLTDAELEFLELACTDKTYKEIAQRMRMTPRGVDVLRDGLFFKLDVKSRVGLAMLAVKNGLVIL